LRPETKLAAFVLLAIAIFLGAHEAGILVGPVTSVHAPPASPNGPGGGMTGMNMGSGQP
jgi:hypothetical protein